MIIILYYYLSSRLSALVKHYLNCMEDTLILDLGILYLTYP
jgi:hypothetical protein